MIHYQVTPELIKMLENVIQWRSDALTATPLYLHYPFVSITQRFHEIDSEYSLPFYVAWFDEKRGETIVSWDYGYSLEMAKKLVLDLDFFQTKYTEWLWARDKYLPLLQRHGGEVTDQEYWDFEFQYIDIFARAFYPEWITYSDELLDDIVAKHGQEIVEKAVEPGIIPFYSCYQLGLIECALDASDREKQEQLLIEFRWIRNSYRDANIFSLTDLQQEMEDLLAKKSGKELKNELGNLKQYASNRKRELDNLRQSFSEEEWRILQIFSLTAQWLDARKEMNMRSNSFIGEYLEAKAKQLDCDSMDLQHLYHEELREVVEGKKKLEDFPISERRTFCVEITTIHHGSFLLSGKEAESILKYHPDEWTKADGLQEFKGQIACRGVVRGKVRLVTDPTNTDFQKGEILVAYMTRPEYVPLMKKASAIITNQGGITSHAAVISRELGIPCIIGTQVATRVLKDGDEVEVDAERGVVRKI